MRIKILIFIFIIVLFIFGCSPEESSVAPDVDFVLEDNTTEVEETNLELPSETTIVSEIIPSCDDDNSCTEDFFNEDLDQCEHRRLEFCCGDGYCDPGERCDLENYHTVCAEDCPLECPGFIIVENVTCVGECNKVGDIYDITGDTKFIWGLENMGEGTISDITSGFGCRGNNGIKYYGHNKEHSAWNVTVLNYFDDEKDNLFLTSDLYNKNTGKYVLEFNGIPKNGIRLDCEIYMNAVGFSYSEILKVNFIEQ